MDSSVLLTVASGGEHPLLDIDLSVVIQLALFFVMMAMGTVLLFKPYLRLRTARHDGIEGARDEASRMSAQADAQLIEYETQLAAARKRAQDERSKVRAESAKNHSEVTEAARGEAVKQMAAARSKVQEQSEAARKELLPKVETLGSQIASKLLGREVA